MSSGFLRGVQGFGFSMLSAVAGLVDQPMQSVLSAPASTTPTRMLAGVAVGVGRGVLGALVKPLGGAMELVHSTSQGLLGSAGLLPQPRNRELPVDDTTVPGPPNGRLRRGSRASFVTSVVQSLGVPNDDEDTLVTMFPQRIYGSDLGLVFVVAKIFAQSPATLPITSSTPQRWLVLTPEQLLIVTSNKVLERFLLSEVTALTVSDNVGDFLVLISVTLHTGLPVPPWTAQSADARRVVGCFRRWKTG